VVLRDPVPEVAEALDVPSQIERVTEGVADRRSGRDRSEIKDGKRSGADGGHPHEYPSPLVRRRSRRGSAYGQHGEVARLAWDHRRVPDTADENPADPGE
jgi:hypothetical protein